MTSLLEALNQSRRNAGEAPSPQDVRTEAVSSAALPAVAASGVSANEPFPKALLDEYEVVFITPGTSWEDIDLFLLAETHLSEPCDKLNSAFIRAVAGDCATVFKECVPSMLEPTQQEQEEFRKKLGLSLTTPIFGWDAPEEILDMLFLEESSTEEGLASVQKKIEETKKDIENYSEISTKMRFLCHNATAEAYQSCNDTAVKADVVVDLKTRKLPKLHKIEQTWKRLIAKGIMSIPNPIESTFPERTQSMITTLKTLRLRKKESLHPTKKDIKAFFLSGQAHLQRIPFFSGEAFDVSSMHAELNHHKAAILIPKICDWKTTAEDMAAELELPRGLVLTPQQITDLKQVFYSARSKELLKSKITEFLEPIYSAFFLSERETSERSVRRNPGPSGAGQDELSQLGRKASLDASHPQTDEESPPLQGGVLQQKAFIDDIIAEIELPRGLVLTPQQISDLKQTLYPAGSDIELITSKITEFLEPIYSALFLSKFNL